MAAVVGHQPGRHALELPGEKQVEKEGLEDVVAVMAKGDFGGAEFVSHPIEDAAAQARTQRAHRAALGDHPLDDRVGVLVFDVKGHIERAQIVGQDMLGKAGLLLVEVDRDDLEGHRRACTQREQQIEQGIAVLAARDADHHLVTRFDHRKISDRLAHLAAQPLVQLVALTLDLVDRAHQAASRNRKTSMPTERQSG